MSRAHSWSKELSRDASLELSYACRQCPWRRYSASGPKGGFRWLYREGRAETSTLPKCFVSKSASALGLFSRFGPGGEPNVEHTAAGKEKLLPGAGT